MAATRLCRLSVIYANTLLACIISMLLQSNTSALNDVVASKYVGLYRKVLTQKINTSVDLLHRRGHILRRYIPLVCH